MPTAFSSPEQQVRAARFGWWVFLSSELLFFAPLLFGYLYGRVHMPQEFVAASRLTDFALGTINTAVLLSSSATMAAAVGLRQHGHAAARWLLWSTAALGAIFLAIKGVEYHAEWSEGLMPGLDQEYAAGVRLYFFLYFGLTGLHAVHLTIGCAACAMLALRSELASPAHVELAGLYWHFVDLVWIFLYPLLYLNGRGGYG